MAKYPDNPYWDTQADEPKRIIEKAVWEEAEAAGHITPEHRLDRIRSKMMYALNLDDGAIAYDEEGFATALVAEEIRVAGGARLRVYPGDHLPPHTHIKIASYPEVDLKIDLDTGEELKGTRRGKLTNKEVNRLREIVLNAKHEELVVLWAKNGADRETAQNESPASTSGLTSDYP